MRSSNLVIALALLAATAGMPAAQARPLAIPLTGNRTRTIDASTLFHTLFSDFYSEADGTTYVQTGDIPAMWMRDSAAQTLPYVRFAPAYPILAVRFAGVIQREANNIIADPYANAFRANYAVWERKWEAGSPAWPVLLAWTFWQQTHSRVIFTPELHRAMRRIVDTWRCEQLHAQCSRYHPFDKSAYNSDTGMIWSAYRPSDDPVSHPFNIPQEAAAAVALSDIAYLASTGYGDTNLANEAASMSAAVHVGIERFGRVWNGANGGWMYVYETDGQGHDTYMDDANIPNLTALPYIGYCSPFDPTYLNTRAFALSSHNPYYFSGIYAEGLGSPHTPPGFVWPLGIIARALTAGSETEVSQAVTTLAETDGADGLIHESFWPSGYWLFTRADFGWANASYAELIFRSVAGFPATSVLPQGRALTAFERPARTPRLTDTLTQLRDAGVVYASLSDLLAQAGNHTIIPSIHSVLLQSAGPGDLHWHQVRDAP